MSTHDLFNVLWWRRRNRRKQNPPRRQRRKNLLRFRRRVQLRRRILLGLLAAKNSKWLRSLLRIQPSPRSRKPLLKKNARANWNKIPRTKHRRSNNQPRPLRPLRPPALPRPTNPSIPWPWNPQTNRNLP